MTARNILQAIKYLGTSGDSFLDIENYEKYRFSNEKIDCHHKREISEGKSAQQLMDEGLYYGVPASDLIFLLHSQHLSLHNKCKNMSGEKNPMFGKHRTFSEETLKKMSDSHKRDNLSTETRRKLSESLRGRRWYNNGIKAVWAKECPNGFKPGRI